MTAFETWGDPIRRAEIAATKAYAVLEMLRDVADKGAVDNETHVVSLNIEEVRRLVALMPWLHRLTVAGR